MRRRWLLVDPAALLAIVVLFWSDGPGPQGLANYRFVHPGMTRAEVYALLGPTHGVQLGWGGKPSGRTWDARPWPDGISVRSRSDALLPALESVVVYFDRDERVTEVEACFDPPSVWAGIRNRLGW